MWECSNCRARPAVLLSYHTSIRLPARLLCAGCFCEMAPAAAAELAIYILNFKKVKKMAKGVSL